MNKEKKESSGSMPYVNREISWLAFNKRVLEEAVKRDYPIMERLRFLAITSSNLDEFFMVRVAGVKAQVKAGYQKKDDSGLTPAQLLEELHERCRRFMQRQYSCLLRSLLPALQKEGILFTPVLEMSREQRVFIENYFEEILFPVLTPLAVDASRPFPQLANQSLNIAVRLKLKEKKKGAESCFAVVQVPSILPRYLELPSPGSMRVYTLLEDIIIHKLGDLFELHDIKAASPFRLTRDSDLEIDEEASDFLFAVEQSIKKRKRGRPVRLEILKTCDPQIKKFLASMLKIKDKDMYELPGPLDLAFLSKFADQKQFSHLCFQPIVPVESADFTGEEDIFAAIRRRDCLVYHPYESFDIVTRFITTAAEDANVLAIKQTLYRVSGNSPIVAALMKAAENGKQVTVLVELKARFDEENNINWAKKLEQAGCHVIYGLQGLKTHCKIALAVRREGEEIRRYLHLGTGNYNDSTARIYTDLGLFTCNPAFGEDASSLFNAITGYSAPPEYNDFVVAPHGMREFFERKIRREIEHAQAGRPCGITIKVNALVDPQLIAGLYEASQAGVPVQLIVRGVCCLLPGVEGISENIRVISIVGQLLEHSRIFRFAGGGEPEVYIGSADWMPRNLDRRIELIFPILDEQLKARVFSFLDLQLQDNYNARELHADGKYQRVSRRGRRKIHSQLMLYEEAKKRLAEVHKKEKAEPFTPVPAVEAKEGAKHA